MTRRRGIPRLSIAGLALTLLLWLLALPGLAQTGAIGLTVECDATPEVTTILNDTDQPLDLAQFALGSLSQPRAEEPFTLSGTLPAGQSRTYRTGSGTETGLGGSPIYDDDEPTEGARLMTPYGTLEVLCSEVIGTLIVGQEAQPTATPSPTGATSTATAETPTPTEVAPTATPAAPSPTVAVPTATGVAPTATRPATSPTSTAVATARPTGFVGDVARPGTAVPRPAANPGLPSTGGGAMGAARWSIGSALALAGLAGLGWWLLPTLYKARGRNRWRHDRW